MRIFITGATGYIGSAVAAACARAGHEVTGLIRSEQKAASLAALEVRAAIGSMQDATRLREVARDAEVLVHCAVEYSPGGGDLDRGTMEALLGAAGDSGRPRLVVYTSGAWIYGNTRGVAVDEASPVDPPPLVGHRSSVENMVLGANRGSRRTLVLRPGTLYGGRGGLTASWFQSALAEGAARLLGDGSFRWCMVHVRDLADAYLKAIESPYGGEIFNVTDRSRFTVLECAQAASRAAGKGGKVVHTPAEEAVASMGDYANCLMLDQHVDSSKAVRLLRWQPRHGGFVDGVERYFLAWRALAG